MDFVGHIRTDHSNLGDFFTYFQDSSVLFNDDEHTIVSMNLVNAFSRHFVFYYQSNSTKKMVNFMIFLLGRKEDAVHYYIEFVIKSPKEAQRRVMQHKLIILLLILVNIICTDKIRN